MNEFSTFLNNTEKYFNENTLYDASTEQEFLDSDQKIMDAFIVNFIGVLALYDSVEDNAFIRRFLKQDKKLRIKNITDANHNISLIIKIMEEKKFFRLHNVPTIITRFLVKLKQGQIDTVDVSVLHEWLDSIDKTKYRTMSKFFKSPIDTFIKDGDKIALTHELYRYRTRLPEIYSEIYDLYKRVKFKPIPATVDVPVQSAVNSLLNVSEYEKLHPELSGFTDYLFTPYYMGGPFFEYFKQGSSEQRKNVLLAIMSSITEHKNDNQKLNTILNNKSVEASDLTDDEIRFISDYFIDLGKEENELSSRIESFSREVGVTDVIMFWNIIMNSGAKSISDLFTNRFSSEKDKTTKIFLNCNTSVQKNLSYKATQTVKSFINATLIEVKNDTLSNRKFEPVEKILSADVPYIEISSTFKKEYAQQMYDLVYKTDFLSKITLNDKKVINALNKIFKDQGIISTYSEMDTVAQENMYNYINKVGLRWAIDQNFDLFIDDELFNSLDDITSKSSIFNIISLENVNNISKENFETIVSNNQLKLLSNRVTAKAIFQLINKTQVSFEEKKEFYEDILFKGLRMHGPVKNNSMNYDTLINELNEGEYEDVKPGTDEYDYLVHGLIKAFSSVNKGSVLYRMLIQSMTQSWENLAKNNKDMANAILTELPLRTKRGIIQNYANSKAFENIAESGLYSDDALIQPYTKLSTSRLATVLKFNNIIIDIDKLKAKDLKTLDTIDALITEKVSGVELQKMDVQDNGLTQEELDTKTIELLKYRNEKHGPRALKVIRSFAVKIPTQIEAQLEWLTKNPDQEQIKPMFHGTGSVAASMVLRYGFAVLTSRDSSVTGRMLGNGVYGSTVIDKIQQYIGDSGFSRRTGTSGYIFEMNAALGIEGEDYNVAGLGTDFIRSPEWCVFTPNSQYKIFKAYEVQLLSPEDSQRLKDKAKRMNENTVLKFLNDFDLNEAAYNITNNVKTFTFFNGIIPTQNGPVDFEDFVPQNDNVTLEPSQYGPMIVVQNTNSSDDYVFADIGEMRTIAPDVYEDFMGLTAGKSEDS